MLMRCAAIFAALFFILQPYRAAAQDVTLRSRDGSVQLSGTLLGFDGEFYRIQTQYGELTVDGSGVLCDGIGCPSLTDFIAELSVSGSASIGMVLLPALIEAFAMRDGLTADREVIDEAHFIYHLKRRDTGQTAARFYFRVTNTDEGFADLLADEADIVMALREIRPREAALAREAGLGDLADANRSRVLALDAVVPVVMSGNPVDTISLRDLSRVLSGDLSNWQELGGPDAPISLHMRNAGSGLTQGIEDRLLKPDRLSLRDDVVRHETNAALVQTISRDPFGIGLTSFSDVGSTRPLTLSGTCGFQLRAARRNIKTEDYPLTSPMFLYLPARRLPAIGREFLAFIRSQAAQIVIRRAGFVDQAPEQIPIDLQGDRFANAVLVAEGDEGLRTLQDMVRQLTGLQRLTTSFRFEAGSARLDAQSRSNVQQLARALEAGTYDTRRLIFVGFSDGQGTAATNLQIARRRAEAVRMAVLEAAETLDASRLTITTEAFGGAMPMACDDTTWGRSVNRRVEVWLD